MTSDDAIANRLPPARQSAARPALAALAIALLFHAALGMALALIDAWRAKPATSTREIPVEVVEEEPPHIEKPAEEPPKPIVAPAEATQQQAEQPIQPPQPQSSEAAQAPQPQSAPQQEPQRIPAPQPRAAASPPSAPAQETASTGVTPPSPPLGASDRESAGLREPPPPPVTEPAQKPATRRADTPRAVTADFALAPDSFHRAAAPAAARETSDEYKGVVFERLERVKVVPAGLRGRAIAVVSFMLDQAGNLVTVTLLQSTGDRTLDAEALALVRRASPFPKPPPGVLLTFAPAILFGGD